MTGWRGEARYFGAIGGVGFLIEAAVLTWLVRVNGWGLYGSRVLSFGLAVTATWYLNRRFTFARRAGADRGREYVRYFLAQVIGALINLGVYGTIIAAVPVVAAYPVLPLAVGSGVAMVFNFLAARHFAFNAREAAGSSFSSCRRVGCDGESG
jgi:putative flippase GtrA